MKHARLICSGAERRNPWWQPGVPKHQRDCVPPARRDSITGESESLRPVDPSRSSSRCSTPDTHNGTYRPSSVRHPRMPTNTTNVRAEDFYRHCSMMCLWHCTRIRDHFAGQNSSLVRTYLDRFASRSSGGVLGSFHSSKRPKNRC